MFRVNVEGFQPNILCNSSLFDEENWMDEQKVIIEIGALGVSCSVSGKQ